MTEPHGLRQAPCAALMLVNMTGSTANVSSQQVDSWMVLALCLPCRRLDMACCWPLWQRVTYAAVLDPFN